MATKKEEHFIGTHAKVILSDWQVLATIVTKHSTLIKESTQEEESESEPGPQVLSQREIDDAFNGPMQAFFKQKITAHSAIARLRLHLTMNDDETFKEKRAKLPDEDKIPESILSSTSLSDLNKIGKELDQLTTEHHEQWEQCRDAWNKHILQRLSETGLSLSEIEIKEFQDPEPISELSDRFVSLNIALPKTHKADMDFSKYLTLKTDIAVQSALSRQHLPHEQSDIQRILKQLKSDFNAIRKQEQQILSEQKAATNQAVANITW